MVNNYNEYLTYSSKIVNVDGIDFGRAKREMYAYWDVYLSGLLEHGFHVFSLNINFIDRQNAFSFTELNNGLGKHYMRQKHLEVCPYSSIFEKNSMYMFAELCLMLRDIECCDILYVTQEFSKQGVPHFHCLFFVRQICIDYKALYTSIQRKLLFYSIDVKIDYLKTQKDIKQYFIYMTKEFDKIRVNKYLFCGVFSKVYWEKYHYNLIDALEYKDIFEINMEIYFYHDDWYCGDFEQSDITFRLSNPKYKDIPGFKFKETNSKDKEFFEIVYYLYLYFTVKDIIVHNGNLYSKIKGSFMSYKYLGDHNFLFKNIYVYLQELSEMFDSISCEIVTGFTVVNVEILQRILLHLFHTKSFMKMNYNILEFKEGLYFVDYNKFIKFNDNKYNLQILKDKFFTIRYFNILYNWCNRNVEDTRWLYYLKKQFNTESELEAFNLILSNLLFEDNSIKDGNFTRSTKRKSLFLLGESNTGKTSLITDIFRSAYGNENLGTLSKTLNFLLENAYNKDFLVCEEVELSKHNRSDILKLSSGEFLPVSQKYKRTEFIQLTNKILFTSNHTKQVVDFLKDDAFLNRVYLVLFNEIIHMDEIDYHSIRSELPKILLYISKQKFNKVYNSRYKKQLIFKQFNNELVIT